MSFIVITWYFPNIPQSAQVISIQIAVQLNRKWQREFINIFVLSIVDAQVQNHSETEAPSGYTTVLEFPQCFGIYKGMRKNNNKHAIEYASTH